MLKHGTTVTGLCGIYKKHLELIKYFDGKIIDTQYLLGSWEHLCIYYFCLLPVGFVFGSYAHVVCAWSMYWCEWEQPWRKFFLVNLFCLLQQYTADKRKYKIRSVVLLEDVIMEDIHIKGFRHTLIRIEQNRDLQLHEQSDMLA